MTRREFFIVLFTVMLITQNMFVQGLPVTSLITDSVTEVINEVVMDVNEETPASSVGTTSLPELLDEEEEMSEAEVMNDAGLLHEDEMIIFEEPSNETSDEPCNEPCNDVKVMFEKTRVLVQEFTTTILTE